MDQQAFFNIISGWNIPLAKVWGMWETLYNYLPPPPNPYPANLWLLAGAMANGYTGPVRP